MAKNSPFFIKIGSGLSMRFGLPTIASWYNTSRPKKAPRGTFGFNKSNNTLEYYDGTTWFEAPME